MYELLTNHKITCISYVMCKNHIQYQHNFSMKLIIKSTVNLVLKMCRHSANTVLSHFKAVTYVLKIFMSQT